LEARDVDDRMARRYERGVAAELAQGSHGVGGPLGSATLALEHEAAHGVVDRGQRALEELPGVVRLGGRCRAFPPLASPLYTHRFIVDGTPAVDITGVGAALAAKLPGDTVELTVTRDGASITVQVTLAAPRANL